jgi:hypothetical protein
MTLATLKDGGYRQHVTSLICIVLVSRCLSEE